MMVTGIIGKKVGMTQLFLEDGSMAPATVLEAGPCVVVQGKNADRDGYEAVQLGLVERKPYRANKAISGHFKKAGVPPTRVRREVNVAKGASAPAPGEQVLCSIFNAGEGTWGSTVSRRATSRC
jgi:large subunit ribosomal protein L3